MRLALLACVVCTACAPALVPVRTEARSTGLDWRAVLGEDATLAVLVGSEPHLYVRSGCEGPEVAFLPVDSCFRRMDWEAEGISETARLCPPFAMPEAALEQLHIARPSVWIASAEGLCPAEVGPLTLLAHGDNCTSGGNATGYAVTFALSGCDVEGAAPIAIVGGSPPRELRWVAARAGSNEALHERAGPRDSLLSERVLPWWRAHRPSAEDLADHVLVSRARRTSAVAGRDETIELVEATFVLHEPPAEDDAALGCAEGEQTMRELGISNRGAWQPVTITPSAPEDPHRPPVALGRHGALLVADEENGTVWQIIDRLSGILALNGRAILTVAAARYSVTVLARTGEHAFLEVYRQRHSWYHEAYDLDPFTFGGNEHYCGP